MDDEQRLNMMDDDRQHMMRGGRPGMDQVSVGGRLSVLLKQPAPRGSYVYLQWTLHLLNRNLFHKNKSSRLAQFLLLETLK